MKRSVWGVLLVGGLLFAGCSGGGGKELLETARFEEKQHNREHAVQLYEEVIRKYPGTPQAQQARERLAQLRSGK
ncbi:MAG TPA: hypothetical protein VIU40_08725 [Geobacteraceae bacterium]